jgi:hypothetical protein
VDILLTDGGGTDVDAVEFAKLVFKTSTGAVAAAVAGAGVLVAVVPEGIVLGVDSLGSNVESTRATAAYIAAKSTSSSSESLSRSA